MNRGGTLEENKSIPDRARRGAVWGNPPAPDVCGPTDLPARSFDLPAEQNLSIPGPSFGSELWTVSHNLYDPSRWSLLQSATLLYRCMLATKMFTQLAGSQCFSLEFCMGAAT
jgi:hypothetical protein